MKRGGSPESRSESSGEVIAGKVPSISENKIIVPSLGLEGLEPEGNLVEGLIP